VSLMAVECMFSLANAMANLASVAVGGIVGFLSAQRISKRNTRAIACAKLRAAFAPSLALIYIARHHGAHDKPSVDSGIKKALMDHGAAVEEFRIFVPINERSAYSEAWEEYRKIAAQHSFDTVGEEWELEAKEGELLEGKINAILSFAET